MNYDVKVRDGLIVVRHVERIYHDAFGTYLMGADQVILLFVPHDQLEYLRKKID